MAKWGEIMAIAQPPQYYIFSVAILIIAIVTGLIVLLSIMKKHKLSKKVIAVFISIILMLSILCVWVWIEDEKRLQDYDKKHSPNRVMGIIEYENGIGISNLTTLAVDNNMSVYTSPTIELRISFEKNISEINLKDVDIKSLTMINGTKITNNTVLGFIVDCEEGGKLLNLKPVDTYGFPLCVVANLTTIETLVKIGTEYLIHIIEEDLNKTPISVDYTEYYAGPY